MIINIYKQKQKKERDHSYYVYVLELEQGKYYVGLSHSAKKRFKRHKQGKGAKWTQIYKPIRIIYCQSTGYTSYEKAGPFEDDKTLELMEKYGRDNVRGGRYCAVEQSKLDLIMGTELCDKVDNHKVEHISKKNKGKKNKGKNNKVYPKSRIKDYCREDYSIKLFDKELANTCEMISQSIIIKGHIVHSWIDHKQKTIWVSNSDMKRYGTTLIMRLKGKTRT